MKIIQLIPLVFAMALTATQQVQTAQAQDPILIKTITAVDDSGFGVSLAFVAPDRLVIGGGRMKAEAIFTT